MRRSSAGLSLVFALLVPLYAAAGNDANTITGSRSHPEGYTGAERCVGCHEAEATAWSTSHHANAMGDANLEHLKIPFGDRTGLDPKDAFAPSAGEKGPKVRLTGEDGQTADLSVAAVIGIYPLQQFLVPARGGRLQALPFAWDARAKSDGGQRWFNLYPATSDDAGLHWTGYNQTWNSMCASCHTTGLDKGYDETSSSYRTTWSDFSVACEACHGPGAKHVAWVEGGRTRTIPNKGFDAPLHAQPDGGYWGDFDKRGIRRWAGGARLGEIDRCAACHARRRALVKDADAPGKPLLDTHNLALIGDGLYFPDGQIKDEVFEVGSFLQSRMFKEHVICTDCHDPHRGTLKAPGNAVCGQCHDAKRFDAASHHHHPPGTPAAQCTSCHMPQRTYMGVHARHDHSFRLPAPGRAEALHVPDPCLSCHEERGSDWAEAALDRWASGPHRMGSRFANAIAAGRQRAAGAEIGLLRLISDPEEPGIVRATALAMLGAFPGQKALAALQAGITDDDPLVRLGAVEGLASYQPADVARPLGLAVRDPVRAVRIEAGRHLAPYAGESDRVAERALEDWVKAEMLAPERPETHLNMGVLAADLGDAVKAEAAFKHALEIDPRFTSAALNLADLYRSLGRDAESEPILRQAVAQTPDDGDAHYALALLLVRKNDLSEALAEFEKAAALKPGDPRMSYALALALAKTGEKSKSMALLEQAHRRFPDDRDLLQALADETRKSGDFNRARAYAEALERLDGARRTNGQE